MEKEKKLEKVTEDTLLGELINNKRVVPILQKYQFPCLACPFAHYEMEKLKIIDITAYYRIDKVKLLEDINNILK